MCHMRCVLSPPYACATSSGTGPKPPNHSPKPPFILAMALKRVRFAVEEERCEHCSQTGHKLREQQRRLGTELRLQR